MGDRLADTHIMVINRERENLKSGAYVRILWSNEGQSELVNLRSYLDPPCTAQALHNRQKVYP